MSGNSQVYNLDKDISVWSPVRVKPESWPREKQRGRSVSAHKEGVTTNILGQDKTLSHETICVHPGLVHIVHLNMNNNGSKETFYLLFVT